MPNRFKKGAAGVLSSLFFLAAAGPALAQNPVTPHHTSAATQIDPSVPQVVQTSPWFTPPPAPPHAAPAKPDKPSVTVKQSKDGKNVTITLSNANVTIGTPANDNTGNPIAGILFNLLFFGALIGGAIWLRRRIEKKGGLGGMGMGMGASLGKSKARLFNSLHGVKLDDVAGVDEAKEDLLEIVDFLENPSKYQEMNAEMPHGVLFSGPPGTGKTLMAKAVAGEAGVPFFSISGSDFVEMYVGVGAARVRDMFKEAKEKAPCIIFIDEIDAVGRHRSGGRGGQGGNDEREQTLNQLLVEMDGFEGNPGIVVIAATNRVDVLDKALLRPGRFDRQIIISNPDLKGREAILNVHARHIPLADDVSLSVLARGTPGFSGAELKNLVNEAALLAVRHRRDNVSQHEFDLAKDKIMMGAERRSLVMTDQEKRMTAYHEGGHALVALTEIECDPVHKATILPRGRALGMVMTLPEGDRISMSFAKAKAQLKLAMGGRVAEEIIFGGGQISNGASSDIEMATNLATAMVAHWGMSEKVGMVKIQDDRLSAPEVQTEVRRLIDESYKDAKDTIERNIDVLHRFASALLDRETLTGEQLKTLKDGGALPPPAALPAFDKAADTPIRVNRARRTGHPKKSTHMPRHI